MALRNGMSPRAGSGRRHDAKGRSRRRGRFVLLHHWMLNSPAWRSLGPASRAIYLELAKIYNGSNNGEIGLGVRRVARLIHIAKDTASKCFRELEAKGFIRRNVCGSFDWKLKHETTWILTEHPFGSALATRDFMRWQPEDSKPGPKRGRNCPNSGTSAAPDVACTPQTVPHLGPWSQSCTLNRSQTKARL